MILKKIFLSLLFVFNVLNLSAMEVDAQSPADPNIQTALSFIKNQPNFETTDTTNVIQTDFPFFKALTIIKTIIFLQKYFSEEIRFDDVEQIRVQITEKASSWLTEKWNHSTPEDFLQYCRQTNDALIQLARNEKNPILKQAFRSREISNTTMLAFDLTVLHWVTIFGLEQMVIYLVEETDCNIDGEYNEHKVGIHTKTPLYYCVFNGLSIAIEKLLERDANPEGATVRTYTEFVKTSPGEMLAVPWITTSHEAVLWTNKPEILSSLIAYNVDTNLDSGETKIILEDQEEYILNGTPLDWAQQIENQAAIEMLQNYNPPEKFIGAIPFDFQPRDYYGPISCVLL